VTVNIPATELRDVTVGTPAASYSVSIKSDSEPRDRLSLTEGFRCFPQSLQANLGVVP